MVTALDDWNEMVLAACRCNVYRPAEKTFDRAGGGKPAGADSPGSDFNRNGTWAETGLFDLGWTWVRKADDDCGLICRPGKTGCVSASVGMVSGKESGSSLFYCWSTSVANLPVQVGVDRFGVFARLKHGGDFKAATRALAEMGYGKRSDGASATFTGTTSMPGSESSATSDAAPPPGQPDRIFLWASELRRQAEERKWLWEGYISRGGITLLSALWKAGKTTLLSHLIRALDGRECSFLGQAVAPSRVLYVTEEHQELWAERRDDLDLTDNTGFVCRPFRGKPSPDEWRAFVAKLIEAAVDNGFDLVVMDTISKLWPVKEENDAGQVEDALKPLWALSDHGIATLLIHHDRKSGGEQFTGSRGSGGLPAFVETIIEFRRQSEDTKDPKRVLNGKGRYRETPDKLLIELTDAGYVAHGDPDNATVRATFTGERWKEAVLSALPRSEPGMTRPEILDLLKRSNLGVREEVLRDWLTAKVDGGELIRTGAGQGRSPYRYLMPEIASPPPGGGVGDATGDAKRSVGTCPVASPVASPTGLLRVGDDDDGDGRQPWWPELRAMIRGNGAMTAEQLHNLSGFPLDDIRAGLAYYVSAGMLIDTDGTHDLPEEHK